MLRGIGRTYGGADRRTLGREEKKPPKP